MPCLSTSRRSLASTKWSDLACWTGSSGKCSGAMISLTSAVVGPFNRTKEVADGTALQGEAKSSITANTCAADGQGCPRGAVVLRMRSSPECRTDRGQLGERLPPLRGGRSFVRRRARHVAKRSGTRGTTGEANGTPTPERWRAQSEPRLAKMSDGKEQIQEEGRLEIALAGSPESSSGASYGGGGWACQGQQRPSKGCGRLRGGWPTSPLSRVRAGGWLDSAQPQKKPRAWGAGRLEPSSRSDRTERALGIGGNPTD